jgi:RNA polymerase sigma factor for flagellar operon FliA
MDPAPEEQQLWEAYRSGGDIDAQQRLFFHYIPWARTVARDVYRRIRVPQMDWSDYAQNATVGLLEAMGRYDRSRGIAFIAYAKPRVRGAVFNGLRSFLADSKAGAYNDSNRWRDRISSFDEPEPEDPLSQMISSVTGLGLGFLLDADATMELLLSQADASTIAERGEMDALLAASVARLPEREKVVVTLHYYQHMPFVDIAQFLGLTKGRVSQIHKAGLEGIRARMRTSVEARQTA